MRLPPEKDSEPPAMLLTRRAAAYATDVLLLALVLFAINFLLQPGPSHSFTAGLEMWRAVALRFSLPTWIYFMLSDYSLPGATMGKRMWGIRVTGVGLQRITLGRAMLRTALKLAPWECAQLAFWFTLPHGESENFLFIIGNFLGLGYFAVAVATRGRRSFHDFIVGTTVERVVW